MADSLAMVLNDGETYTSLTGCHIVLVPESYEGDLEEYIAENPTWHTGNIVASFVGRHGEATMRVSEDYPVAIQGAKFLLPIC